jgi:hypothetical protein
MPSPAELKSVTTTPVLHWKKKKIQCGCTCVYELLIAFSKCLTERHAHIRQQSEAVGLSFFGVRPIRKFHKNLKSYGSAATLNHALKYM